jgi:hypothetical protein
MLTNYTSQTKFNHDTDKTPFSKEWYKVQPWEKKLVFPKGTPTNYCFFVVKIFDSSEVKNQPSSATLLFDPRKKTLSLIFSANRDRYMSEDYAVFSIHCKTMEDAEKFRQSLHK